MPKADDTKAALADLANAVEEFQEAQEAKFLALEAKFNRQVLALGGGGELEGPPAWSSSPEEAKAWGEYLRTGETKAMTIGSDPEGGYAAPPQFADQITLVGAEQGAIRSLARVYTPGTSDFYIPVSTTLAGAGRTTESSTRANTTTPSLAKVHPMSGGVYAVAPVSNWLLNDSKYDLASYIAESIGQAFGVTESADFVSGDGVNKAMGFSSYTLEATADATRAFGTIEKLHAGSVSAFDIDDLIDLRSKLAPRYRKNACWCMHPDTESYVRKLKASTSGDYYWQPAVAAGAPNTLLGNPVCIDVNMPVIASGAAVVAIADWTKFYAIVDIGQTTLLRDPYTSKGNTLFYVEKRTGGGVVDSNAGKLLVMSV
jgi:HK97 family phage major capsid protein